MSNPSTEIVAYAERIGAMSIVDIKAQVNLIQHVMREVMQKDQHYGVIPGTGTKPTLLKAGAEKLCLTFRMDPQYESTEKYDGQHLTVKSKCVLYHIPTGQRLGSGEGSCSTKESKYAYRTSIRKCPNCDAESIIKGKDFKNDGLPTGWVCFSKKGGCGAKFKDGDEAIEKQTVGRVPNEDLADQYNTVLKMADKRSLVAAVMNTTAASDIFTQDIEDMGDFVPSATPVKAKEVRTVPELHEVLTRITAMRTKTERESAKALADQLEDPAQIAMAEAAWAQRIDALKRPAADKETI